MLNARCWLGLFSREQNPKPISYFRTDFGVVVCIEVGGISVGHCTSLMQFALPNTSSGKPGIVPGEKYKSEHWLRSIEGTPRDVLRTIRRVLAEQASTDSPIGTHRDLGPIRERGASRLVVLPVWVTSRHAATSGPCRLYPRKRTQVRHRAMSEKCQIQT